MNERKQNSFIFRRQLNVYKYSQSLSSPGWGEGGTQEPHLWWHGPLSSIPSDLISQADGCPLWTVTGGSLSSLGGFPSSSSQNDFFQSPHPLPQPSSFYLLSPGTHQSLLCHRTCLPSSSGEDLYGIWRENGGEGERNKRGPVVPLRDLALSGKGWEHILILKNTIILHSNTCDW